MEMMVPGWLRKDGEKELLENRKRVFSGSRKVSFVRNTTRIFRDLALTSDIITWIAVKIVAIYIYIYSAKRPSRRFHKFPGFKRRHFVTAAFPNGSLTKRFDVYTTRYKKYNFRVNFRLTRWKCFAKISIRKEISIDRIRAYMNKLENLGIVIRLEEEKVRKIGHR